MNSSPVSTHLSGPQVSLRLSIRWIGLGVVSMDAGRLRLPDPPDAPGVYRFYFTVGPVSAEYLGEAASLPSRFASYATAHGRLGTNTRMRTRMERTLTETDGTVEVYIAEPELEGADVLDLGNKLIRVFVEHAAATDALLDERSLLNGSGYPPMPGGSILSGSPFDPAG